jgi:hypothetical protein
VVPADVYQPDEAALPNARNRKCASSKLTVELLVPKSATDSNAIIVRIARWWMIS